MTICTRCLVREVPVEREGTACPLCYACEPGGHAAVMAQEETRCESFEGKGYTWVYEDGLSDTERCISCGGTGVA